MKKYHNVLLVDDDDSSNFLNKRIIEKLNLADETHVCDNGKVALEYIMSNCRLGTVPPCPCPDIVLLDINMPVMNGFEFLSKYETTDGLEKEKCKIYILTSSSDPNDLTRAKDFHIEGYINKPLTREKLLDIFQ